MTKGKMEMRKGGRASISFGKNHTEKIRVSVPLLPLFLIWVQSPWWLCPSMAAASAQWLPQLLYGLQEYHSLPLSFWALG